MNTGRRRRSEAAKNYYDFNRNYCASCPPFCFRSFFADAKFREMPEKRSEKG
ncbi:hypothetical protein LG3211_4631 [Lysobacter gummosus]|nr:hypothetical protein LG3211_4631 [Lysobacter gummosus]